MNILLSLFWVFLKIGTFSFGGGLAVLSLIEKEVVASWQWLTSAEFVELVSISQITPGPIGINAATFVGARIAGVPGALIATLGVILVPFFLMTGLARLFARFKDHPVLKAFFQGLRPAVAGLIFSAALSLGASTVVSMPTLAIAAAAFILVYHFKASPILIIAAGALLGLLL